MRRVLLGLLIGLGATGMTALPAAHATPSAGFGVDGSFDAFSHLVQLTVRGDPVGQERLFYTDDHPQCSGSVSLGVPDVRASLLPDGTGGTFHVTADLNNAWFDPVPIRCVTALGQILYTTTVSANWFENGSLAPSAAGPTGVSRPAIANATLSFGTAPTGQAHIEFGLWSS